MSSMLTTINNFIIYVHGFQLIVIVIQLCVYRKQSFIQNAENCVYLIIVGLQLYRNHYNNTTTIILAVYLVAKFVCYVFCLGYVIILNRTSCF